MKSKPKYLTPMEAAELLRVDRRTIYVGFGAGYTGIAAHNMTLH